MPFQVGVQSGAKTGIHNHLNISQGGILNAYSRYGAYRETYSGAATVAINNNTERSLVGTAGLELIKSISITDIGLDHFQTGSFTISYQLRTGTAPNQVDADIAINHNGVRTWLGLHSDITGVYANKTRVFTGTLYQGDVIEIWADDPLNATVFVRNMQVSFGWRLAYFGDGTINILNAPLALTDTDNPFTTVNVS